MIMIIIIFTLLLRLLLLSSKFQLIFEDGCLTAQAQLSDECFSQSNSQCSTLKLKSTTEEGGGGGESFFFGEGGNSKIIFAFRIDQNGGKCHCILKEHVDNIRRRFDELARQGSRQLSNDQLLPRARGASRVVSGCWGNHRYLSMYKNLLKAQIWTLLGKHL